MKQQNTTNHILQYFEYKHLPGHLQAFSKPLYELAHQMDETLPNNAEKSAGLRKLLEAKDCFVRAALEQILVQKEHEPFFKASVAHVRETGTSAPWEIRSDGMLHCAYCGSLHPEFVAKSIKQGAMGEWADWKYGWPHKAYFTDIPGIIQAKFYSAHLLDADPEDKTTIEQHLKISFEFLPDGRVKWSAIS